MDAVAHLAPTVGIVAACDCLSVARASFYRQRPPWALRPRRRQSRWRYRSGHLPFVP